MGLAFFWIFFVLMAVGMPVVFALLVAPALSLVIDGKDGLFFAKLLSSVYTGIYSFPLMAVPFFILAGELMNSGGITRSIVKFSESMIGHVRGGLAQVNILSSILFAGLSGSAVADTSALGKMLIPAMEKNGYSRPFAAAVTAASSVIGPIIPPSGIMILYAFVMNVSVAGLFLAGFVPGLMVGLGLMALTAWLSRRRGYPVASHRASWSERSVAFLETYPALLTPVLLLGGILSGIYTPTEAAAVAAFYALFASALIRTEAWARFVSRPVHAYLHILPLTVFLFAGFTDYVGFRLFAGLSLGWVVVAEILWRLTASKAARGVTHAEPPRRALSADLRIAGGETARRLPDVLRQTAIQSGIILLLVGAAVTFGWMVTVSGLAREAAGLINDTTDNPYILLFLVNILLFVVGMFLDAGPAILILGPVLGPIMTQAGVDPLHFAIVMCVNVTVGLATPPMGLVLFVAASVANERLERIVQAILPFLVVEFAVIFLITYFPSLTMTIPALAGFARCPSGATLCEALVGWTGN
ncbi:tripartite ATP-independent transporter DctM subunit [Albidovulum inexpectatum]|uniref:Tripartite ATP-independent transporter DctM subunit n=1 Tax=Albidovulum inexpectatum TaxID=196587 RepID=A0A2S5JHN8_9RHOB|nr:TRAP transporter large permease [Albidovulum inexpectatum]PPB80929.1 tripartite ATP-independent transporter DctM subunit [Albidovulum inexpectatum]